MKNYTITVQVYTTSIVNVQAENEEQATSCIGTCRKYITEIVKDLTDLGKGVAMQVVDSSFGKHSMAVFVQNFRPFISGVSPKVLKILEECVTDPEYKDVVDWALSRMLVHLEGIAHTVEWIEGSVFLVPEKE